MKMSSGMESDSELLTKAVHKLAISSSDKEEVDKHQQGYIPHDLFTDQILKRLPIKCLLRFKSVSKLWYATVSSYRFAIAHFRLYPFSQPTAPTHCLFICSGQDYYLYYYHDDDDGGVDEMFSYCGMKGLVKLNCNFGVRLDELCLVGSCNGLVCLGSSSGYFIIWNPITLQFRKVCDPYHPKSTKILSISWGFGYTSSVDDYKVVRIIELPTTLEIIVHVFSLRTNIWRRIGDEMYRHLFSLKTEGYGVVRSFDSAQQYVFVFESTRGVLVNEILHWIVNTGIKRIIVSFDLSLEKFDKFPHLDDTPTETYMDDFLCVMGGYLCSWCVNIRDDVGIKILHSPGVKEYMFLSRHLNLASCEDPVGFTTSGKFFTICRYGKELGLIDLRSSPVTYTRLMSFRADGCVHIAYHVPSLFSPDCNFSSE